MGTPKKEMFNSELKNPRFRPEDIKYVEQEPEKFEDFESLGVQNINEKEESPFKDLKTMVNKEDIDVKTYLTSEQIEQAHRINNFAEVLRNEYNDKDCQEAVKLLDFFTQRAFELKVNKDGLSRKEFIQIVGEGEKKVQEAQQSKLQKILTM